MLQKIPSLPVGIDIISSMRSLSVKELMRSLDDSSGCAGSGVKNKNKI